MNFPENGQITSTVISPTIQVNTPSVSNTVKVPGLIIFLSWLYMIDGVCTLGGLLLALLIFFVLALTGNTTGVATFFLASGVITIVILLISLPISILSILLSIGFRRMRKWALILFSALTGISLILSLVVLIIPMLNKGIPGFEAVPGVVIDALLLFYIWSKRSLFMSKKEATAKGVMFDAKLYGVGKFLIYMFFILIGLAVIAMVATLLLVFMKKPSTTNPIINYKDTSYSAAQASPRDNQRIQDIQAIDKALENNFSSTGECTDSNTKVSPGSYCPLQPSSFYGSKIPQDPNGQPYLGIPSSGVQSFVICAKLETNSGNSSDANGTPSSGPNNFYYCLKSSEPESSQQQITP